MGLFLYTLLFPGGKEEACRAALERKAENPDRNIQPENCQWHTYPKGPAVQLNDGAMGFDYAGPLSKRVNCPVLLAYIYDDDFWGYELWRKGEELDQFASLPDYFDQGEPPDKPGDAELLARLFDVEPERISRYLTPWPPEEPVDEYAYEGDVSAIGDSWQMADFLGALGFDYDRLCPPPPPEPEKEPNQPAPPPETGWRFLPPGAYLEDTPDLPSALTSRKYEMERDLGKALELEPGNVMALRARCPTTATTARYSRHIRDLTLLMELDPENRDVYQISRAYRFHWTKDDAAARADLEEVLRRGEAKTVDLVYLCKELGLPGF